MATRIYVGGLPYSCTDDELQKLFAAHGTVTSATVITDRYTGQAKGFGFVEMPSPAAAQAAMAELQGQALQGRMLNVNEARPRDDRRGGGRPSDGRRRSW